MEYSEKLINELNKRYKECDSSGHRIPDENSNKCNYCYRELKTDLCSDRIREEMRKGPHLSAYEIFHYMNKRKEENFLRGLECLKEEYEKATKKIG